MKILTTLGVFFFGIAALAMLGCGSPKKAVLLIARETSDDMALMIEREVNPIIKGLNDAGFAVVVASSRGQVIRAGSQNLAVQKRLLDIKVGDYVAVVVPCMAAGGTPGEVPADAIPILKKAVEIGMPLAAQQSGVRLLGNAGALAGKKFAIAEDSRGTITDGTYSGTGVIQDGNVLTSGTCPYMAKNYGMTDGTSELISKFVSMLK
jgi:putative intracellular protease/amidase